MFEDHFLFHVYRLGAMSGWEKGLLALFPSTVECLTSREESCLCNVSFKISLMVFNWQ